ncbi:MAG: hypothetical protein HYV04_22210 [Deltaproteobacteria bacterium]|nr:hypothetical protein [Deltaproteobacteria bacterium]
MRRIGIIIPSSNCLVEPQFQRYAPPGVGVHVTRLRMTGKWHKTPTELRQEIAGAAAVLSDAKPGIIVFHCTASSMEEGVAGEARLIQTIQDASGCPAITTAQAITQALRHLRVKTLVLISPYVEETNQHEARYLREAGFDVIHDFGLALSGSQEYMAVSPRRWVEIALANQRAEAGGYLLSCANTTMIEAVSEIESRLNKPVVNSNQATLWACLEKLGASQPIAGLGRLCNPP